MRVKLYKYTPHIESFIKNPMLKCTIAAELNDPFELNPSSDLALEYMHAKDPNYVYESPEHEVYIRTLSQGVISLSESKNNILMWSHYANEHRGGVIEFSFDIKLQNNNVLQRGLFKNIADNQYAFNRVKYMLDRSEINNITEYSKNALITELLSNFAFCKADPWSYEKEHRFLCSSKNSDRILISIGEHVNQENVLMILDEMKVCVLGIDSNTIEIDKKAVEGLDHYLLAASLKNIRNCSLMYFYEVNLESVTGLYFGCEYPLDKFNDIVASDKLNKFVNLGNNTRRATLSKKRYELEFTE